MAGRKKEHDRLVARAKYIQKVVKNSRSTQKAIDKVSKRLFISESSAYKDLQRDV